jgi:hypothetical protein
LTNKQITVNCGVPHVSVAASTYKVKAELPSYNVYLIKEFEFEVIVACPTLQSVSVQPSASSLL